MGFNVVRGPATCTNPLGLDGQQMIKMGALVSRGPRFKRKVFNSKPVA